MSFSKKEPKHSDLDGFLTVDEKATIVKLNSEISANDGRRRELTQQRRAIMNRALQRKLHQSRVNV